MILATQSPKQDARQIFSQRAAEPGVAALETARLVLRAPRRSDVKALVRLANDRRVAENLARVPHPYTPGDAEEFIASVNRQAGEATYMVTLGGEAIGACGVEARDGAAEIGYWLGVPHWGCGFATEAVRAVIDHAFGVLDHRQLFARARVNNPASRRVLEKCGFQWTGVGLYRIRAINSSAPLDRFRLDRGLWASLKAWGRVREAG